MKKIFLTVLMLCCMAGLAHARIYTEMNFKGGILASPYLNADGKVYDVDMGFTLGAEGYIFCSDTLGLGIGVSHLFDTDVENTAKKMNYTDIFFSVKPEISLKNGEVDFLYFIGQIGASNANIKILDGDSKTGIYIAGGVGIEAGWFLMEAVYSYRQWSFSGDSVDKAYLYTLALNIGFKFSI